MQVFAGAGTLSDLPPFSLSRVFTEWGIDPFLFVLGRTYLARRFTHEQAVTAIVVSYYWHFVDVVWIGLFFTIYVIQ